MKTRQKRIESMILILKENNQRVNYITRHSEYKLRKKIERLFDPNIRSSFKKVKQKIEIKKPCEEVIKNRAIYSASNTYLKKQIIKRDGAFCKICKIEEDLSLDHIKPLSKLGTNDFSNLQILCRKCNAEKGDNYHE